MSKRMISLLLAALLFLIAGQSTFGAESAKSFSDVSAQHWAASAISWGVENNILDGFPDGTFAPEKPVTEAEFLKILIAAYVTLPAQGEHWYDRYYAYASDKKWYATGLTEPSVINQPILRKHAALILSSALGASYSDDGAKSIEAAITDLYDRGLSSGKTAKTIEGFAPDDTLTRAEATQFIYKFVSQSGLSSLDSTAPEASEEETKSDSDASEADAGTSEEWTPLEEVTFADKEGVLAKHELFAKEQGLKIRHYESNGTNFIQLISDVDLEKKAGSYTFSTSYKLTDDGSLTWTLITDVNQADPGDAFEFAARMFEYNSIYSDSIRTKIAQVTKQFGYQIDWEFRGEYDDLTIKTFYIKDELHYYIVSTIPAGS